MSESSIIGVSEGQCLSHEQENRAIAGVFDDGFSSGWESLVPSYPSYMALCSGPAVCSLESPGTGRVLLQMHLFIHADRPPAPKLQARIKGSSWEWDPGIGWHTIHRYVRPGKGKVRIHLAVDLQADRPWWEIRVSEISLLLPSDPRVRNIGSVQ